MQDTLIMPKQTGREDAFYSSLRLYYDAYQRGEIWYSNADFKREIQVLLPYLTEGSKNKAYLVKQSELVRYFGLVKYDYSQHIGRAHITDRGLKFYEAYLRGDKDTQIDIICKSIFNDSFGRNNTAIKASDSDVDAPKLFIRSMYDLGGITSNQLANLLYFTHDLHICYDDAIEELCQPTASRNIKISKEVYNKYSDVKFTVLLKSLGICTKDKDRYYIAPRILDRYKSDIKNLSIYNQQPKMLSTLAEVIIADENIETKQQDQTTAVEAYDVKSKKFVAQNNRSPISYDTKKGAKYGTDPRLAKTALALANFKCQIDPDAHLTFLHRSGNQFMEAHHLIPMKAQKDIAINIDRIENIVCICPICHKAIHLGDDAIRLEYLKKLYDLKEAELKSVGLDISFEDLAAKYYK